MLDLRFRNLQTGPVGNVPEHKLQSSFIVGKKSGDSRISLGEYGVFVSVGLRDGSPRIALPLGDGDGALRYRIGTIRLTDE